MLRPALPALLMALAAAGFAHAQEKHAMQHAHGTFTVKMTPQEPAAVPGTARFRMEKSLHGDLEGTSTGEMYSAGNPAAGAAGYVAMEQVSGTLGGRSGTFVLQHMATMDAAGPQMRVVVTPGSGTGALAGISGTFTITIAGGQHSYDLEYSLPAK